MIQLIQSNLTYDKNDKLEIIREFSSMPPSIEVESKMKPPQCIYTVNSPSGNVITNARVGELVDHQWICQSSFKGY